MDDRHGVPRFIQQSTELKLAANIPSRDNLCGSGDDLVDFPLAQLACGVRLNQVVDTSRTTAERGFGKFQQFQPGDGAQRCTRLLA